MIMSRRTAILLILAATAAPAFGQERSMTSRMLEQVSTAFAAQARVLGAMAAGVDALIRQNNRMDREKARRLQARLIEIDEGIPQVTLFNNVVISGMQRFRDTWAPQRNQDGSWTAASGKQEDRERDWRRLVTSFNNTLVVVTTHLEAIESESRDLVDAPALNQVKNTLESRVSILMALRSTSAPTSPEEFTQLDNVIRQYKTLRLKLMDAASRMRAYIEQLG